MTTRTDAIPERRRSYLPAAGHDWFLPLYDPFVKLLGGDRARRVLLDQAAVRPGHHVLDVGCGTGTFVVLVKRLHPNVEVIGLDPDPKALARATRKAEGEAVSIRFDQGFADRLPYSDASFDRVFSSFMFHHLQGQEKAKTLHEARRVLKPGGRLYLLDFGGPESGTDRSLTRRLHSSHLLRDNSEDGILELMRHAAFEDPKTVSAGSMVFGLVAYSCYAGSVPMTVADPRAQEKARIAK